MSLDLEGLLAPVSDDNPVGDDLAYDTDRQVIESVFETSASGEGSGSEVDWRDILKLIESQSAKTKDIWLPIYMMRVGVRMGRLETVVLGAQYLAGLVETYWENMHPQIEEYGFQGRKAPCESLTRIAEFLGPFKQIKLLSHPRLGEFSVFDFERFNDNGDGEDGYGMFRAVLAETTADDLDAILAKLDSIIADITRTDQMMTSLITGDTSVNFATTYESLKKARTSLIKFMPHLEPEIEESDGDSSGSGSGASSGRSGAPGSVESREDVIRAIDAIADYYRRKEPSSPVPLALKRAREWVTLDFMAVLEDIAPNSLSEAQGVLLSKAAREAPQDDSYSY